MSDKVQVASIGGLLATMAGAAYMVIQLHGQVMSAATGNFTNAAVAEVTDAQGQVVLRGPFVVREDDEGDVERKASLTPTGVVPDAAGEAEIELARSAPARQEIEFSVRGVQSGAAFTFVIDGHEVATGLADRHGRVEKTVDVTVGNP